MVELSSIVCATSDQVSSDIGGETVILSIRAGIYYSLDAIGTRIWQLLQEARPVAVICDTLLEEYDVDRESCEQDLLDLLNNLMQAGLLEVKYAQVV